MIIMSVKMTSKAKVGKVGTKSKEDAPHELESQFILRLPQEYASTVRRIAQSSSMNMKDRLTIELHADGRHGIVRVDRVPLACKLVDLPCILESLKTVDKKTLYKTADLCQMLVCTLDGDLYPPLEEPTGTTDSKNKKKDKDKDKKFVWNHGSKCLRLLYRRIVIIAFKGILRELVSTNNQTLLTSNYICLLLVTLPLKNTRKRRFRKTAKKKYIESPDVEKEVKRLLSTDAEAVSVRWEVIAEDESKEPDNSLSLSNLESSPGTSGHKVQHDELREIFNDISSSSEDEDEEGERHEDEDLNIMDTEDDMVRQLHEKLNESDGGRDEGDTNSQIVMEYQLQINNLKAKLQETRARKKQQEKLIMEVENQALRDRFQGLLNGMIRQEEQEMEQLASLQEQLDSLIEK
ncbi:hypothetical protein DNTS_006432 [Danionella cerebrum]|uniref:TAFII55 protein conserved region domain-containing protein n=1 Tax=Danionella cerebrum TaxID=2873325 RepID=A0A553N3Y0_9TELE|nr:hypothetical protein DNTS_006432 [Danionella translucida]